MKNLLLTTTLVISLGVTVYADDATSSTTNSNLATVYGSRSDNDLSGRFGVGLIVGEPTGASLKYFMNDTLAVDGAVGWSFRDETDFYLHSDFLWHKFDLISVPRGQLPFYLGVGGWAKFRDPEDNQAGLRFPIGVSYIFDNLPLDIFAEIAPTLELTPSTRGGITAGVGVRWWF
jgi:hypothetical protein